MLAMHRGYQDANCSCSVYDELDPNLLTRTILLLRKKNYRSDFRILSQQLQELKYRSVPEQDYKVVQEGMAL